RGVADRMIDGAIPGIDAPVMAKYSPNAMILGFIISLSASLLGMFALSAIGLPVIIPGMVQHFFLGGITATYGNNKGGGRRALFGSVVIGIMMAILSSLFSVFVAAGISETVVLGDSDFTLL